MNVKVAVGGRSGRGVHILATLVVLIAGSATEADGQAPDAARGDTWHRHHIETFPIMAFFHVYSVQYAYGISPKYDIIAGLAYVNVKVEDRTGAVIGRLHAPTLPMGLRRYLWKNAHVEYQIWPAYNAYYDNTEDRYYSGFDLYNEMRAGYRFDFVLTGVPLFVNAQYVYGFGLYPGNKPDNFIRAVEDAPPFHVPSLSIGLKF